MKIPTILLIFVVLFSCSKEKISKEDLVSSIDKKSETSPNIDSATTL